MHAAMIILVQFRDLVQKDKNQFASLYHEEHAELGFCWRMGKLQKRAVVFESVVVRRLVGQ